MKNVRMTNGKCSSSLPTAYAAHLLSFWYQRNYVSVRKCAALFDAALLDDELRAARNLTQHLPERVILQIRDVNIRRLKLCAQLCGPVSSAVVHIRVNVQDTFFDDH